VNGIPETLRVDERATRPAIDLWIGFAAPPPMEGAVVLHDRSPAAIWALAARSGVEDASRVGVVANDADGIAAARAAGAGAVIALSSDSADRQVLLHAQPDHLVEPDALPALLERAYSAERAMRSFVLLNPGPGLTTAGVRRAATVADVCHREPEFGAIDAGVRRKLRAVADVGVDWRAVLLAGSGTLADEAALRAAVRPGARVVVVRNGVYGERLHEIARRAGFLPIPVDAPWTEPVDPAAVAAELRADVDAVAVVHHETTTGLLNPLAEIAAVTRAAGVRLMVDAVSSFGAEPITLRGSGIDFLACSANKCLHGLPGLAFVLVSPDGVERAMQSGPATLYADLRGYLEAEDRGSPPFTPSVPATLALDQALDELLALGVGRHQAAYRRRAAILDEGFQRLGLRGLVAPEHRSSSIRTVTLPEGVSYDRLHALLKQEGFVIYAGQGPLAATAFRVACMGALDEELMSAFVERLGAAIAACQSAVVA
jgi:2-aminoethylphosphonate-pyruvate transaminase